MSDASLLSLIKQRRLGLLATYSLTAVENALDVLFPWAIGVAINGVLAGDVSSVSWLVGLWSADITFGTLRRRYDTRLFESLFVTFASTFAASQRAANASTSETAARVEMSRDVIGFFETQIPEALELTVLLLGGVALLYTYDSVSGTAALAATVFGVLLSTWYGRRVMPLHENMHDQYEGEVDALEDDDDTAPPTHFQRLASWQIRLSDNEAANWAVLDIVSLGVVLVVLFRLAALPGAEAGTIFAALAYALRVGHGLGRLPPLAQELGQLQDMWSRLQEEEAGDSEPNAPE
ncbi:MAG: ABC-type multidrug transport system fused ATPase/permease subunit [Bradymonadia bacterium]|jgi:ABC-type multidrug transport system fused ATPase/permease subunit